MPNITRSFATAICALVALNAPLPPAQADGLVGSYLAAGQASYRGDFKAAATYFRLAAQNDPSNLRLKQSAIINGVLAGEMEQSLPFADDLLRKSNDAQLGALVLIADALRIEDYARANAIIANPKLELNPLMRDLLRAWIAVGLNDIEAATGYFDGLAEQSDFGGLGAYHKALMLAYVGDFDSALTIMEGTGAGPLRISRASLDVHVKMLLQAERPEDALALIEADELAGAGAQSDALRAEIEAGGAAGFDYIRAPIDGAAEVILTLATLLDQEDAARFATLYARLAQHIRPDSVDAHLLVADLLEVQEQHELAIIEYARVPEDVPVFRNAEIGRADAMSSAGRTEDAIGVLRALAKKFPEDRFVNIAFGDLLRGQEQYAEAATAYSAAIDLIEVPGEFDWRTYYVRGITNERLDDWDQAEADFRRALELSPDQPLVLNYLGYSLVEKRIKIDEARDMIERAVAVRPDDGYITDSLGWVLYRLGDFEGAVPHMERAAELLPIDPIINDHLGDVYWKVGRTVEAEFQWRRALSFDPEPEDAARIRQKLEVGLDEVLAGEGDAPQAQ